jgi:Secretion system C-terminal sorting domain
MKHLLLFLAISGLITSFLGAQENPVIKEEQWKFDNEAMKMIPFRKKECSYQTNGNLDSCLSFNWDKELNAFRKSSKSHYFYSTANNKLERELFTRYDYNGNEEPTWFKETLYSYYTNGCIEQIIKSRTNQNGDTVEREIAYYDEIDCHIDSLISYYKNVLGEWQFDTKYIYLYEPLKRTIKSYGFSNSEWVYIGEGVMEEDINGNVIRGWSSVSDFAAEEERLYEYDNYNNVVAEEYYIKQNESDSLRLAIKTEYQNTYNENNQLKSIEIRTVDYDLWTGEVEFEFTYNKQYSYYCDELLKEGRSILSNQEISESIRYYYQKGTECEEQENYEVTVSPNPVTNLLTIESQALLNIETSILIVDSKGSLVYFKDIPERISTHIINFSALPSGMYYIIIDWNSGKLSEKVVKL